MARAGIGKSPRVRLSAASPEDIDRAFVELQNVFDEISAVISAPIIAGILLTGLVVTAGTPLTVNHGLDRTYRGWIVVRRNADARVWESSAQLPDKQIILNASSTVTVDVWVF